jgi:N utilization substance protein A
MIKSAVREPGDRAKIAVSSNEKDVDPVGACVGMKGSRVQSIIKELRGEKIDIIEWSDEPSVFAANALSPAKVSQVRITDINNRKMKIIVTEDQLSLAIGKRGQNVRLATRLVGWDIDIVSEDVLKKEIAQQMGKMIASGEAVPITVLQGVTANQAEDLKGKGITDVESLVATSVDDLVDILDVSMDEAERILASARDIVEAGKAETQEATNEGSEEAAPSDNETTGDAESNTEIVSAEENSAAETIDEQNSGDEPEASEVLENEKAQESETSENVSDEETVLGNDEAVTNLENEAMAGEKPQQSEQ